jgi:DNA-3-methyladenine glycosylase
MQSIDEIDTSVLRPMSAGFFQRDVETVAEELVGTFLFTVVDGTHIGGQIIETEAYDQNDPAAHCYCPNGQRPPNFGVAEAMFHAGGFAYVFGTQNGWCVNFVSGPEAFGSAVLIRALKPAKNGIEKMRQRHRENYEARWVKDDQKYMYRLCQGPELLCVALAITNAHNTKSLELPPFDLRQRNGSPQIVVGPRVRVKSTIEKNEKKSPIDVALKNVRSSGTGVLLIIKPKNSLVSRAIPSIKRSHSGDFR